MDEPLDEAARRHLSGLALPAEFERAPLWSSPLIRAMESAVIVGRRPPRAEPLLTEMSWGAWEGRRGVELLADEDTGYRHIEEWGWDFQPPGGETPAMVWERLQPFLATLAGTNVAFTHIGIMRVILARATGWEFEGPAPFRIKRDRLYPIIIERGGRLSFDGEPVRLTSLP